MHIKHHLYLIRNNKFFNQKIYMIVKSVKTIKKLQNRRPLFLTFLQSKLLEIISCIYCSELSLNVNKIKHKSI